MLNVTTSDFRPYGYLLNGDFSDVVEYLEEESALPLEGNIYTREDEEMFGLPSSKKIHEMVFGLGEMEAGYCNGHNTKLNCMEFHACPEVNVAGTDMVLLLALPKDIVDGKLDSSKAKAYFVPEGTALVLRPYVLHFSPCMYKEKPFRCAVFLSGGTNRDLALKPSDPLLWKENKWLLAHPESKQAKDGAYIGITGENTEVL